MSKPSLGPAIRLRGVRHNNLKNFDLDLPLNQLVVVTGLSGSGKSSLAFDTLFAEGQRRYIETFSPYARQFFDRMDKPQVDSIEAIPPAIAIEQRNAVKTTRSTVGTMTEICDHMKVLWPHLAQLHCRQCGRVVRKDSPRRIWSQLTGGEGAGGASPEKAEVIVAFDVPLSEKLSLAESLALLARQGYQRLLVDGAPVRLEEVQAASASRPGWAALTVIQDRLKLSPANRGRFIEACEQAYHFGKGKLAIYDFPAGASRVSSPRRFSNRLHCAQCDIAYREPSPALFSFNHPVGACPACKGFGRVISIDYELALPDRSRTLAEGVVKPWQTGHGLESQQDLMRACAHHGIPTNVPFERLPKKWQDFVVQGEPGYGEDEEHEWPRAWYGVKGYFRWLESKAYKMHVRVLLSRYRAYSPCPDCQGARFQPETLLYLFERDDLQGTGRNSEPAKAKLSLSDFYALSIRDACRVIEQYAAKYSGGRGDPIRLVLDEVRSRLGYLNEVGLGYLTLDRPTRSLSGGETERVNLTTCLGTRLVNTLFVLDEPSVGLHPRDTERLVRILEQLRDAGNTVVVVEHEASVMQAADQIIDLGPGHGATGGQIVFQGAYRDILKSGESLTGQYLSGRKAVELPERRVVTPGRFDGDSRRSRTPAAGLRLNEAVTLPSTAAAGGWLKVSHATRHNLKDLSVEIPLGRFVCITGVSGSGKTTLVREVVLPALETKLRSRIADLKLKASDRFDEESEGENEPPSGGAPWTSLDGWEKLGRAVLVDQSALGKTPRSNPAVYIGAFDDIREFFAQSEPARQRALNASAFSFNSAQGQCERCRGAGFEKIEMQFLSDVFIRCPDCNGRRYRQHILEVKIESPGSAANASSGGTRPARSWSIGDVLEATVDEVTDFLAAFPGSRPARRALSGLRLLQDTGLGYLRLGQPINTLSGGESQRLKLVRHLMAAEDGDHGGAEAGAGLSEEEKRPALFLFDEPTTGLHFDDIRVLLKVFQRLVNGGHSVVVVEHNLDVIKSADWIIDLGPEAGDEGGQLVAAGTPEEIAACERSYTGRFLRDILKRSGQTIESRNRNCGLRSSALKTGGR